MPGSCARHKRDKKIGHRPCPQRAPGAPSMETKIHQFMPRAFAEGLLYAQHGLGSEAFAFSMPVVAVSLHLISLPELPLATPRDTHTPNLATGPPKSFTQSSPGTYILPFSWHCGRRVEFPEGKQEPTICFSLGLSFPRDELLRNDSFVQKTWGKMIISNINCLLCVLLHMH